MPLNDRTDKLRRQGGLGVALLKSTAMRPTQPLKLNFCLTYWCQYRCKTCNIWQRKPTEELTTEEIRTFVRENPHINWVDLTGGEIFLRPDIDAVFEAIICGWRQLAILHFPTNGFLTDRIVRSVKSIAGRGPAHTVVTVSLDGDEATNDDVRGIKGGFRRQIDTFKALRAIPGVKVVFGMTLSSYNVGQFTRTFEACARECPGLTIDDLHLNVAQVSGHYYGNDALPGMVPSSEKVAAELAEYRRMHGRPRSAEQLLERVYLSKLEEFLASGQTPMPCHALRASCFIDPWGVVYPCITYSRPIGRLRDTSMRLAPIWESYETRRIQQEIWSGDCPQCWTACEAYQSILGNALALRWHSRPRRTPAAEPTSSATEVVR